MPNKNVQNELFKDQNESKIAPQSLQACRTPLPQEQEDKSS